MAEMEKHRIVLVVPVLQELDSPINVFKQAEKMLIFLCNARSTTYLIKNIVFFGRLSMIYKIISNN